MVLGVGFVLQQHAAEQAPKAYFLRLRLIADLMGPLRWLAGLAVMALGQPLVGLGCRAPGAVAV